MPKENKAKTKSAHKQLFILGAIIIVLLGVATFNLLVGNTDVKTVKINEQTTISVEIADDGEERIQGLSGRESLAQDTGMLFVFEPREEAGVWMKDMKFSIDVIWMNTKKEVITLKRDLTPESYPQVFYPQGSARYMLEVQSGFIDQHGIELGDRFAFE